MRRPKKVGLWLMLLLIATSLVSVVAWGEINLKTGKSGEAQWWYCGEHSGLMACTACSSTDCYDADHWGVELATYSKGGLAAGAYDGDWAYLAQQVARRFALAEVESSAANELAFDYNMVDVAGQPAALQTASGPSMAFSLIDPVTEDHWLAISEAATPLQTATCNTFDAGLVDWWYAEWDGEDVSTFDLTTMVGPIGFATAVTGL